MSFGSLWAMASLQRAQWHRKVEHRFLRWQHGVAALSDIKPGTTVLLVSAPHELAETQLYPFYHYREVLAQRYKIRFAEISIDALIADLRSPAGNGAQGVRRVFFQPAFEMPADTLRSTLQGIKDRCPGAQVAFMDWFAPLHVRPALVVDEFIDIYIKKQVFKDFAQFAAPTRGDTNLNDHYARKYDLPDPPMQYTPPAGLDAKMRLGSNFGLSPLMLDLFLARSPRAGGRDIDLHARIAVNGVPWYQAMRQEAQNAVDALPAQIKVVSAGRVKRYQFFAEMQRSKMCFSPFGYGEVCWRDYEAFATGALLLKPDVSHLSVLPDVFEPGVTYVPLQWDLSDFEEQVQRYLRDDEARKRICDQAFARMRDWILSADYARQLAELC